MKRMILFFLSLIAIASYMVIPRMCNNRVNEEKQIEIIQLIARRTGCNDYDRKYTVERGALRFHPTISFNQETSYSVMLELVSAFGDMEPEYSEETRAGKWIQFYRWIYENTEYRYVVYYDRYSYQDVECINLYWHELK